MRYPRMLAVFFLFFSGCSTRDSTPNSDTGKPNVRIPIANLGVEAIQRSKDPEELSDALIGLCRSKTSEGRKLYMESLQDTNLLRRLDSRHLPDFERWERLTRVLRPICDFPSDDACQQLLILAHCREFMGDPQRVGALIEIAGGIRNPSQPLLDFLDSLATPDSWQLNVVIPVFAEMRSPAACDRLEKRFHSSGASIAEKKGWLTHDLIRFRNDPSIVTLYKRLIMSNALDPKLREIALDTLFCYRPDVWYRPNTSGRPKPLNRGEASTEVLMELASISTERH